MADHRVHAVTVLHRQRDNESESFVFAVRLLMLGGLRIATTTDQRRAIWHDGDNYEEQKPLLIDSRQ